MPRAFRCLDFTWERARAGVIDREVCAWQVGMYQTHTHEISGKPVVDANKYALQVLDRTACKHLGIQNQERALIGVRGQRKDMGRGFPLSLFPCFLSVAASHVALDGCLEGCLEGCLRAFAWLVDALRCVQYASI